jgi:hypothetical protein
MKTIPIAIKMAAVILTSVWLFAASCFLSRAWTMLGHCRLRCKKVTVFSAGLAAGAKEPDAARALIKFFTSPAAASTITKSGLEPVTSW